MDLKQQIEELLPQVQKPARYVGNEWNVIKKDHRRVAARAVLAFPDLYEVGMSNLGMQILYESVNRYDELLLERTFAPAADMESLMRRYKVPLFSLESFRPVKKFDLLGFSLQYELTFTNVLNMLDLAGIPLDAARREKQPLVIGGGPAAFNPEPLAPFFDLFLLGDGEEALPEILFRWSTLSRGGAGREEILRGLAALPGVYVPSLYRPVSSGGAFRGLEPLHPSAPKEIDKSVVTDLNRVPYPTRPVVPYTEVVHDRAMLELFRGCARGCRFCQAGIIYRPVRRRQPGKLAALAREIVESTGYDELSLASLSSADYPRLDHLIKQLQKELPGENIKFTLPSLRADSFSVKLSALVQQGRHGSLTFAPEVATDRLRKIISKDISEKDLFEAFEEAVAMGRQKFKLYFMIGLPGEREEDVLAIVELCSRIAATFRARLRGRFRLSVSVSTFVPKAHTPFQWEPLLKLEEVRRRQELLDRGFKKLRGVSLRWHDAESSFIEAVLARGDRELAPVLGRAWRKGCRFDSWSDSFSPPRWREAFREEGRDPEDYAYRRFSYSDPLPWGHLSSGVGRQLLTREHRRAMEIVAEDYEEGEGEKSDVSPDI